MPPKLLDCMRIEYQSENPKRNGTKAHDRYERYKVAKTVGEALQLGAQRQDVSSDIKQGYCKEVLAPPVDDLCSDACNNGHQLGGLEVSAVKTAAHQNTTPVPLLAGASSSSSSGGSGGTKRTASDAFVAGEGGPSQKTAKTASADEEVDLSFVNFDGKPMTFIKRVMGEAKRLLRPSGQAEATKLGYRFDLKDRDNLSRWAVRVSDLNPEGDLAKDLAKHRLEACIDLELSLPDRFPILPPFARVVYPQLVGGYVFSHGGICFEPLTAKGWVPSMSLPALAIAIKGILDYGGVRVAGVGDREARTIKQYTEEGARRDHSAIVAAHRDGDGATYGSMKHLKG